MLKSTNFSDFIGDENEIINENSPLLMPSRFK